MRQSLFLCASVAALVGSLSVLSYAEIKETDKARLERAKTLRTTEVDRAAERYQKAIADADQKTKVAYGSVIQQYTKAGDQATADLLQQELDTLLAASAEGAPGAGNKAVLAKGHNKGLIAMIGPSLVNGDGTKINTADLASVEHVLLYYSASWCGPCRAFTPTLVEFFNEHAESKRVMVVLVGRDRTEAEQTAYLKDHNMPWPAVPFKRLENSGLLQKYGGRGIPNLVLLNGDGTVASGSYVDNEYVGPNKVLADLRAKLADEASASAAQ